MSFLAKCLGQLHAWNHDFILCKCLSKPILLYHILLTRLSFTKNNGTFGMVWMNRRIGQILMFVSRLMQVCGQLTTRQANLKVQKGNPFFIELMGKFNVGWQLLVGIYIYIQIDRKIDNRQIDTQIDIHIYIYIHICISYSKK